MHNVFSMVFEGRLLFAPINRPRCVLQEQISSSFTSQLDGHLASLTCAAAQLGKERKLTLLKRRVLDLGHGTGSWAFEVAEHYSQCEV